MKDKGKFFDFFKDVPPKVKLVAFAGFLIQGCFTAVIYSLPENQRLFCYEINACLIILYIIFLFTYVTRSSKVMQKGLVKEQEIRNSIINRNYGGIINYFPSRAKAIPEIMQQIISGRSEVFISGVALSSISVIFKDETIIREIANNLLRNGKYNLYIIVLHPSSGEAFNIRDGEIDTRNLVKVLEGSLSELFQFRERIKESTNNNYQVLKRVHFKYYLNIMPRHFILKSDHNLSIGSYFSHMEGGSSYLLTLRDSGGDCLYRLFDTEVEFIKNRSQSFDIDKSMDIKLR